MAFDALPLVLVQDILQLVVRTWDDSLHELVALRRVNREHSKSKKREFQSLIQAGTFEHEVTKLFARGRMQGAVEYHNTDPDDASNLSHGIKKLGEAYPDPQRDTVGGIPRDYGLRLLIFYIGEEYRGDSFLSGKMHAVVDFLMQNLSDAEKPENRHEAVHAVCEALSLVKHHDHIFSHKPTSRPRADYRPGKGRTLRSSFLVAVAMQYNHLVHSMLESGMVKVNDECQFLGAPIDMALRLGYIDMAKKLFQAGACFSHKPANRWFRVSNALKAAMKAGHTEAVLMAFERLYSSNYHFQIICRDVVQVGISWHQLEALEPILDKYWNLVASPGLQELFLLAAGNGYDDFVQKYVKSDGVFSRVISLEAAALGGYVSTCRILLETPLLSEDDMEEANVLWRIVARNGNTQMLRLFEEFRIPMAGSDYCFLPIAAENGQLDMAKYAVEQGLDQRHVLVTKRRRQTGRPKAAEQPKELLRYFALLRAVIRNHPEIVRWLVQEVAVDVNGLAYEWWDSGSRYTLKLRLPMALAIDSGNLNMARLLLELGAAPVNKTGFLAIFDHHNQVRREDNLRLFSQHLLLGSDHETGYESEHDFIERTLHVPRHYRRDAVLNNTNGFLDVLLEATQAGPVSARDVDAVRRR